MNYQDLESNVGDILLNYGDFTFEQRQKMYKKIMKIIAKQLEENTKV